MCSYVSLFLIVLDETKIRMQKHIGHKLIHNSIGNNLYVEKFLEPFTIYYTYVAANSFTNEINSLT